MSDFDNLGTSQLTVESLKKAWSQLKEFKQGRRYSEEQIRSRLEHNIGRYEIQKMLLKNSFKQGKISYQIYEEAVGCIEKDIVFLKDGLKESN